MYSLASLIIISSNSVEPVYQQIANQLLKLIKGGTLTTGHRLPSTRELSEQLKVHRKTIVRAYDELLVQGWLQSETGNGTFVSEKLPFIAPEKLMARSTQKGSNLKTAGYNIDNADHLARKLIKHTSQYHLDDGYPDGRLAPLTDLSRAYRTQLRAGNQYVRLGYGDPKGSIWLREELCTYFAETRGLNITSENILITRGTIMGLYLVSTALLKPGDNIVIGDLGWTGANMNFLQAGANVIKIPVDGHGIIVDELREICRVKPIRMVYVTPHHNYPTTVALRADRRMQLLQLAKEFDFIVFEDDYDYDFHYQNKPLQPLAGADVTGHVLYCGSFTKAIAPAFRIGYLVGPENVIQRLATLRRIVDRQGDNLVENAVAELLQLGIIQKHVRKSLRAYHERRDLFCELLKYHLQDKVDFKMPEGGMALWATFDQSINIYDLQKQALARDIYINDGSGQFTRQSAEQSLRLGFASSTVTELEYIAETLGKLTSCQVSLK
ncbi:PLP-dependent aminotransferase family protein [Mucilaginibacter sp. NFR10]|jgi:GntR family transcriptional regulator/MocR family aminotransferase|uniref:MocR-like pyridoxine biosynthesis transcription factor PdxR n=2 Tax=unclassified Mucilaginibacter TaxID=2617802 RepID=UPI0008714686|nr:PLP-dependent aminotransferase family protein [Mucilaginibacter sp. NFR10]SCW58754.1 GntR family transcriptional regulator / MocR family aminotransferase [Mucilaginibacter sp. NFR10]